MKTIKYSIWFWKTSEKNVDIMLLKCEHSETISDSLKILKSWDFYFIIGKKGGDSIEKDGMRVIRGKY